MALGEANREKTVRRARLWTAAILLATVVTYSPTFGSLWKRWTTDSQYSIAPLVPLVSGYFAWRKWPETHKITPQPCRWGLAVIGCGLVIHILSVILDVSGGSSVSMLMCLIGGCLYFRGLSFVRCMTFPLAYLGFAVPVPGGILDLVGFPLQLWAAGSTAAILNLLGIEAYRSGVHIVVAGSEFQVALACSGLSSLVALTGVVAVVAYISRLPVSYKWFLFGLAWPVALIANMIRITTITLIGYQWGQEAAIHMYHQWSSPLLFVVAMMLLLIIQGRLEWLNQRRTMRLSS